MNDSAKEQVLHAPDWSDFRDHIPTADAKGKRVWVYPKKPAGFFYRARTRLSYLLLILLFAGPFIRIGGNPLLMMNFVQRKFVIFGQIFWPQDNYIFALAMITGLVMIVLFTAVFGRVWCGWLCPQTVLMEMVFRKIEYWIEGDAYEQRQLDRAPWAAGKFFKKGAKHALFLGISFVIGNTLLAYLIGSDALLRIVVDNPINHAKGLAAMSLFTLMFYGIFARFREQACTFICPYGRFQSVLLDENSIVVAYDFLRGERRGRFNREQTRDVRRAVGIGDCIGCGACVTVCPTGIDIRNGTQMECVHCAACIDACDAVMDRVGFPRGLIRYASQNGIARREPLRATPRVMGYCAVLLLLTGLLVYILSGRTDVEASLLRSPGTLYQVMPDGNIGNLYLLKLMNKTSRDIGINVRLLKPEGSLTVAGGALVAGSQSLAQSAVIVELPRADLANGSAKVAIGIFDGVKLLQVIETNFIGPTPP